MLRKTARQLQVEINSFMAALDKDEPVPSLIGRLTTIIALSQAGMALSAGDPFGFLKRREERQDAQTAEEKKKHG
jgi:hypothetical protein